MSQFFPVGKSGASTVYQDKAACELAEGQECFDVSSVDIETVDAVDGVLVENPEKVSAKLDAINKGLMVSEYERIGSQKRGYGQRLISITTGYTSELMLSPQDSLALAQAMAPILSFANLGRIDLAKASIQTYQPDQYFTQEFKDLLLWEIQRSGF